MGAEAYGEKGDVFGRLRYSDGRYCVVEIGSGAAEKPLGNQ